jgi:adenylylsulfate kinase
VTGAVVWVTGLPGAGKSTFAAALAARLREAGREPLVLDGDAVRGALSPSPGYDDDARDDFYRTLGRLAALAAAQGLIVVVPATAHRQRWRDEARARAPRFVEVLVATSPGECRRRDPRGLYADPRVAAELPGVGAAYDPPAHPEVVAPDGRSPAAVDAVLAHLRLGGLDGGRGGS